eukprot:COSAG06_NODE_33820_length_483_cov_7.059896_1_plen_23_part_01
MKNLESMHTACAQIDQAAEAARD